MGVRILKQKMTRMTMTLSTEQRGYYYFQKKNNNLPSCHINGPTCVSLLYRDKRAP
jgi:hypothetical protein